MTWAQRGKTAVVGVGTAGIGAAPGYTHLDLTALAVSRALADAGMTLSDVDGLFTANMVNMMATTAVGEYLGIHPVVQIGTNTGGNAFVDHLQWAALALDSGMCDVALICYGSNQRTSNFPIMPPDQPIYDVPFQPREPISSYALAAARHMHQYGTTREQLAQVAVSARQWAQRNPQAFVREPLTVDDVLRSRMISDPLTVLDCCLVTDGAGAVVMTRTDRAADAPHTPIHLLASSSALSHRQISAMPDLTVTAAAESSRRAYAQAGLAPADVDVVQLYDAFTINVVLFLEDLGFCAKGEGGPFVADGRIGPNGTLPVNTNGGGLSCVHPGMYGIFTIIEAVTQLRGDAGERQIAGAKIGLCHGNGGLLANESTALFGTPDTC